MMNYLLSISFPSDLPIREIIISVIASIIATIIIVLLRKLFKPSGKQEKKKIESLLMHSHEVKPTDIMGDRGEIKYGYREDSWFERKDLEKELINSIQSSNSCVTVITGKFASGKSRLVHHFLTSEDCQFKWVYAPNTSTTTIDEIINTIKSPHFNSHDILLVLDDIDEYYRNNTADDLGLTELMNQIHYKRIKTIITVTEGTYRFDDFKNNCKRGSSNSFLHSEGTQLEIKFIRIKDIVRDDDCHKWCIAELKDDGFSTVIGGYVPELSREIPTNIDLLSDEDKKTLVTHYVSTKYRRHEGNEKELIRALHQQLWREVAAATIESTSFDKSLGHLVKLGFLGKVIDDNDNIYYRIGSQRLYHAVIARCAIMNDKENKLEKLQRYYTQRTHEGEEKQIDCYLNMEASNLEERALTYSRLISHCIFDNSVDHIWNKMKEEFNLTSITAPAFLDQPIGDIIRRKKDGLDLAKELIEKKIIQPSETIISNLLSRTRDKVQAIEYINTLPHINDEDVSTIFYLSCKELASPDFDDNRVRRAQQLYTEQLSTSTDSHLIKTNYIRYCDSILKKAISSNRIDEFWSRLTTNWHIKLLLGKKSFRQFFEAIGSNNPNGIKNGIILNAYKKICDNWEHITFYDVFEKKVPDSHDSFMHMTQFAITQCKSLDLACDIYEYFKTKTNLIDNQVANRVSYPVFERINPKKSHSLDRVRNILVERIQSEESPERCHKMINTYLKHMSSLKMINSEIDKIIEDSGWQNKKLIDRDTINIMLAVLRNNIHEGDRIDEQHIENNIVTIIGMLEKHGFNPSPHFNTLIYSCAQELIQKNASTELIEKVRNYARTDITNRDAPNSDERVFFDISERARIPSIISSDEAINVINDCIKYIDENGFLHPDMIANIIQMYFNSFKSHENVVEIKMKINTLIKKFDRNVKTPNYPYCKQKMRFMMSEDQQDIKVIIDYIEGCFDQLVKMGLPLEYRGYDLYLSAIHDDHISVSDAFELLAAAAKHPDKDEDSTGYDPYTYYFKASLITEFMKRLQKSHPDIETFKYYLDCIQNVIKKHSHLSYIQDAGKISKIITDFGIKNMGIDFPITSRYASLRHEIWDNYASKQELYKLDEKTINRFIEQENKGKQSETYPYGDYYIKRAQEELDSRQSIVEKPVDNSLDNSGAEVSQG